MKIIIEPEELYKLISKSKSLDIPNKLMPFVCSIVEEYPDLESMTDFNLSELVSESVPDVNIEMEKFILVDYLVSIIRHIHEKVKEIVNIKKLIWTKDGHEYFISFHTLLWDGAVVIELVKDEDIADVFSGYIK